MVLIGTPAGKLQRLRKWGRDAFAALLRAIFTVIAFVGWLAGDRNRDPASLQVEKILLIRVDLLGDLVLTMPAVAAVRRRYPKAHITMLVLPYTAPAMDETEAREVRSLRKFPWPLRRAIFVLERRPGPRGLPGRGLPVPVQHPAGRKAVLDTATRGPLRHGVGQGRRRGRFPGRPGCRYPSIRQRARRKPTGRRRHRPS